MSAALVKELRERTGLGLLECKKALAAAGGDVDKAIEELRKSSGMKAAKKAGRTAADGVVATRLADDGSYGIVVEVNSETDFVARDENFLGFVGKVVDAAFEGKQTDVAALMAGELEAAREALVQKIGENIGVRRIELIEADDGVVGAYVHGNNRIAVLVELQGGDQELAKDVAMHIIEKMIGGRIKKFLAENSLIEQAFVKDPDVTVGKLVSAAAASVASFVRFEVGEGIEVEKIDFADEVAAQLNG
jgi:elongation factor Ts